MPSSSPSPSSSSTPPAAPDHPQPDRQNTRIPGSLVGLPGMQHGVRGWTSPAPRKKRKTKPPAKAQIVGSVRKAPQKSKAKPRRKPSPTGSGNGNNANPVVRHAPVEVDEAQAPPRAIDVADVASQLSMALEGLAVDNSLLQLPAPSPSPSSSEAGQSSFGQTSFVNANETGFEEGHQWACSTPLSTTTSSGPQTPPALEDAAHRLPMVFLDVPQHFPFPNLGPFDAQYLPSGHSPYLPPQESMSGMYHIDVSYCGNVGAPTSASTSDVMPGHGFSGPFAHMVSSSPESGMVFQCPRGAVPAYMGVGMKDQSTSSVGDPQVFSLESLTDTHAPNIFPLNEGPLHEQDIPFLDDTLIPSTPPFWTNGRGQEPVIKQACDPFYCACPATGLYNPNCSSHLRK